MKFNKTYIVAEIGSNHNNSIRTAKKIILSAKKCGADAVKFQLFKPEKLYSKDDPRINILAKFKFNTQWLDQEEVYDKYRDWIPKCDMVIIDELRWDGREQNKFVSKMKMLVTGERHRTESKYKDAVNFYGHYKFWMSSNHFVPFDIDEKELTNRIGNKMIRPTTVPQSLEELVIEQAIAREALRLSFVQHKAFAVNLKGVQKERTISDAFEQSDSGQSLVDMMELDLIVGSGGVLSHAPRREQSAKMLIDSFLPEGITSLAVDSIFMMPQLGVMANIEKKSIAEEARVAALEVFEKDCLIRLGTCVAPVGSMSKSEVPLKINLEFKNGEKKSIDLQSGELIRVEVGYEEVKAELIPAKGINVGAGKGEKIDTIIFGGQVGLIFDGRGRPLDVGSDSNERISNLKKWASALNEYPELKE